MVRQGQKERLGELSGFAAKMPPLPRINHIQCMPSFFAARGGFRLKVGFSGVVEELGTTWGLERWGPRAFSGGAGGPMGASTPHMGRARGLETTWLICKPITLARGSLVLLTNLHPPPGPSSKCGLGQGGVKCWQVCRRREACRLLPGHPPNNTPTVT